MAGPPLKKLKGDMPALTATSNHTVVIGSTDDDSDLPSSTENNVTLMLPPKPILADEISEDVELAKAYTCTVNDAKSLSKLVKYLSCEFPLGKIGHLKRVKKGKNGEIYVLLCLTELMSREIKNIHDLIKAKDIIAELGLLKIVHVPMKPPITRTQFENCSKYWPTSFHEDKVLEKIIRCESFTELELKRIGNHMQLAIDVSQHAEGKQLGIGAVVVDPSCDEVIAVATDLRHENILHHCTMVAIDLVARSQGGGAYNDITIDKPLHYRPPLSADYDVSSKDDSLPYLCTSYDLYITREPCAMCSMALTHSRINRVFYHSSVAHGALGSRYKIHCQKGLNHHYKVFQTFSNKECERS